MTRRRYKQRILWNAITVEVTYDPDWLETCGVPEHAIAHLQLRSLKPEGIALPVTETGYRSHFLPAAAVLDAGGPMNYVRTWLNQEAASQRWKEQQEATRQYALL